MTDEARVCVKCGAIDSNTHHVQYVVFNHPITGVAMDVSVSKHIQCCAEDGCGICLSDVTFAKEVLGDVTPGDAFNNFMVNKPSGLLQELFEVHGISSPEFE